MASGNYRVWRPIALAASISVGLGTASPAADAPTPGIAFELCPPATPVAEALTCIVDGDSFRLGGERIELAGIDAPEIDGAECLAELALGVRATEFLAALLNTRAWVMRRVTLDAEGRTVARVHFGATTAGELLVSAGLARTAQSEADWCGPLSP